MRLPADDDADRTVAVRALVHELNNVLSAVLGYAEIVHADAVAGAVEERDALQVLAATRRAIELTDELATLLSGMSSPPSDAGAPGSEPTEPA